MVPRFLNHQQEPRFVNRFFLYLDSFQNVWKIFLPVENRRLASFRGVGTNLERFFQEDAGITLSINPRTQWQLPFPSTIYVCRFGNPNLNLHVQKSLHPGGLVPWNWGHTWSWNRDLLTNCKNRIQWSSDQKLSFLLYIREYIVTQHFVGTSNRGTNLF